MIQIRYIVKDVDAAIAFYCGQLGFELVMHPAHAGWQEPGTRRLEPFLDRGQ